jgi:UDP-4-amino-4,6-dideoxy-N-acetyl-beta-L-altrosamine transaminase
MGKDQPRANRKNLMTNIPYGRQAVSQADIDAVIQVLRSDFLTQGSVVPDFENSVAKQCNALHAVAVNSATSALHIACLALGVGRGDVVWTSPLTFVASANCALFCGATVDFVDIDPRSYNISVDRLAEKLVIAEKIGKLPKVVIPVHLCGQPADMAGIFNLGQKYGFRIIEDASHAVGGRYKDEPIGNCRYSDITVFSFHPVKIITTGEGGMVVTNDPTLAKKMRLLRSHGITNSKEDMLLCPSVEIWNYQQIDLGFNYRMTDIQAALGLSQLGRLDEFITKRRDLAQRYDKLLSTLPLQTPWQHSDSYSAYHLYVVRFRLDEVNKAQRQIYDALHLAGILVNLHYIPVYRQPFFAQMGFKAGYCPNAEQYYSDAISIPLYPSLNESQQDRVVAAIHSALET